MFKCNCNELAVSSIMLVFVAIFSSTCNPCIADAGTPLVLGTWFQLYIGNAVIGWLEAVLIARFFRLKFLRALWLMVMANYVSGFAGAASIPNLATAVFDGNGGLNHLSALSTMFWELLALLFVITVFIEWPFVFFAFPPGKDRLRRSLLASLLAQSCSYLLLMPLYAIVSETSLMSGVKVGQSLDFSKNKYAYVYFLGNEDHRLYRVKLDGSKPERLPQKIKPKMDRDLCIDLDNGNWLLCAVADRYEWWQQKQFEPLLKILNPSATRLEDYGFYRTHRDNSAGEKKKVGEWSAGVAGFLEPTAAYVGTKPRPDWYIRFNNMGFVSVNDGIKITRTNDKYATDDSDIWSGKWFTLGFETPLLSLWCREVSLLPEDQLVFEIGRTWPTCEIMLYDLHSKQLAPVASGRSPIVLLDGATEAFSGKLTGEN